APSLGLQTLTQTASVYGENVTAKIVAMEEWKQKTKENYKKNLSFSERTLMTIGKPLSALLGVSIEFNSAIRMGLYKDRSNAIYVSVSAAQAVEKYANRFALSKKFQAKINKQSADAFKACEDHSDKLATGKIRPINWI
ncbi:MAG: hypothetical protein KGQ70_09795, partial [Alphaproteobacteria bacterium]|nr:hypothetical protein [Alphaproteobacteria bacterium]